MESSKERGFLVSNAHSQATYYIYEEEDFLELKLSSGKQYSECSFFFDEIGREAAKEVAARFRSFAGRIEEAIARVE